MASPRGCNDWPPSGLVKSLLASVLDSRPGSLYFMSRDVATMGHIRPKNTPFEVIDGSVAKAKAVSLAGS